jgi:uncharacterized protein YjbI with pentapeptide repeats
LLTTPAVAGQESLFRPVELFQRLEDFYLQWCEGEFIDMLPESLPHKKMRLLRDQLKTQDLGQRQIDIYAGLNVMILLLELHRYGQERDEFKDKMVFYPCGKPNAEGRLDDANRLLRLIGYSCCVGNFGFVQTVGTFLSGANLSGAELSGANLSGANLSGANLSDADLSRANLSGAELTDAELTDAELTDAELSGAHLKRAYLTDAKLSGANLSYADLCLANLSGAFLSGANLSDAFLSGANLSGTYLSSADLSSAYLSSADLSGANLSGANLSGAELSGTFGDIEWDENTNWENVRGLDTAVDVPEALRRQLGMQ